MDPIMNSSVARHLAQVLAGTGLTVVALSACSGLGSDHTATSQAVAGHPVAAKPDRQLATAAPSGYTGPHFGTPQAAMGYLTSAYNGDNQVALHAVTTPQAFGQLTTMRSEAVNLQLQSCVPSGSGRGDYVCTFQHDYPVSLHQSGHGSSRILVAPAENPGWYMYTLLDCG